MGIITDIQRQVKNKNRVSLFVDHEFLCGLDALTVAKFRLVVGEEIDEKEILEITFDSEVNVAFDISLRYITSRMRSKKEIKNYLLDRDFREEVIRAVIEKLEDYGYVDDFKFCLEYVNSYYKKQSRYAIKQGLRQICSNPKAIDEAIESITDEMAAESACRVASRYMAKNRGSKTKMLYKLHGALYQRGYGVEEIASAIEYIKDKYQDVLENTDEE